MCFAGSTAIKQSTSFASSPAEKIEMVERYAASRCAGVVVVVVVVVGGGGGRGSGGGGGEGWGTFIGIMLLIRAIVQAIVLR